MTQAQSATQPQQTGGALPRPETAYEKWIKSTGLPIHGGYYVEDGRTVELGWWPERECNAAFLMLEGLQGVSEARITEIPPGKTLPPLKFALDEVVYVLDGRGLTTVWRDEGKEKRTFEWQKHSLFLLPRNHYHQFSNTQGDRPVRLLHQSYLPLAMTAVPEGGFFFNNPQEFPDLMTNGTNGSGDGFYSEATVIPSGQGRVRSQWVGNFFPDMRAWDKLVPFRGRGAGGTTVFIQFPGSPMTCHMSVFDAKTYKKGHRHGPGFVLVIPAGEGYSIMWQGEGEKQIIPWHEGSIFVPPRMWFHQHFNVGDGPARYLALHPPREFSSGEQVQGEANQIEYPNEDPFIRNRFEGELGKRGLKSIMPAECYQDLKYEWDYSAFADQ